MINYDKITIIIFDKHNKMNKNNFNDERTINII